MSCTLFLTLVFLTTSATRGETPKCDRICKMDLQEMNGLVGKIRSESDVNVRTAHAEQLMVLAKKDPTRPYGQSLVTQIADLLDDPADSVRYWIATTLGFIGPQASAAVPQLERALVAAEKISASKTSASAIRLAIQRIKGR